MNTIKQKNIKINRTKPTVFNPVLNWLEFKKEIYIIKKSNKFMNKDTSSFIIISPFTDKEEQKKKLRFLR